MRVINGLVLALTVIFLLSPQVFAADATGQAGIRMTLAFAKPQYVVGEPVDAVVAFQNTGESAVRFLPHVDADWWFFLKIQVQSPDGTFFRFRPGMGAFIDPKRGRTQGTVMLAPGERCLATIPLTVGSVSVPWLEETRSSLDYTFDRPGEYLIQISYRNQVDFTDPVWKGELSSPAASLRVVAPEASERAAAARWDTRVIRGYLAHMGMSYGYKEVAAFSSFLEDYPDSVFSDYARFYLAECYAHIIPYQPETELPLYRMNAISLYRDILARGKPEVYLPQARLSLADCYRKMGNVEAARQTAQELISLTPAGTTSTTVVAAQKLLAELPALPPSAPAAEAQP